MVQHVPLVGPRSAPPDRPMVLVPGARTRMGCTRFYAEETPEVDVVVPDVLWLMHPVTNTEFAAFVESTGHVTVAEEAPDPDDFPGADPELLVPGSQVFTATDRPVPLDDWTQWWRWCPGASWRAPEGPGSDWHDVADHPVVHVGWEDAAAYAAWAGLELPSEAEFEHAARGGLVGADYAWGDELHPDGAVLANTWLGDFPWRSADPLGFHRTSPVAAYRPNGYGLFDLVGNVWEWTRSRWTPSHASAGEELSAAAPAPSSCGGPVRPRLTEGDRMVTKGGSHLCSPQYCRRYRPAARQGHGVRDTTSHLGFRCVGRP
jgi:formylglycine-generating enzyme required for sulfatase activity